MDRRDIYCIERDRLLGAELMSAEHRDEHQLLDFMAKHALRLSNDVVPDKSTLSILEDWIASEIGMLATEDKLATETLVNFCTRDMYNILQIRTLGAPLTHRIAIWLSTAAGVRDRVAKVAEYYGQKSSYHATDTAVNAVGLEILNQIRSVGECVIVIFHMKEQLRRHRP